MREGGFRYRVDHRVNLVLTGIIVMMIGIFISAPSSHAQSIEALRQRISDREERIEEINEQIEKYQQQIQQTSQQANTLENRIAQLRATQQKLQAEINSTQEKIQAKSYTLDKLSAEISNIVSRIETHKGGIEETIQKINVADSQSLIETLLKYDNLGGFWNELENLERFQAEMRSRVAQLKDLKRTLTDKREKTRKTKKELEDLQNRLSDKNEVLAYNKQQKQQVLQRTENKESRYRQILEQKREQRRQFLKELNQLESQLQVKIDESKLPGKGQAIFSDPLPDLSLKRCTQGSPHNCVTQYFGNTSFSKRTNAYSGNGHNGVDFNASVGTEINPVQSGTVAAHGNTDIGSCQSYGKWVLIEHENGISTLYTHLSTISVNEGASVSNNTVIGYTGNTGYSTGPHLHFSVFATEGVQVINLADWYEKQGRPANTACSRAGVRIPVAPHKAYLDPLHYF